VPERTGQKRFCPTLIVGPFNHLNRGRLQSILA